MSTPSHPRFLALLFVSAFLVTALTLAQEFPRAVPDRARPLPLAAVRLTGGPLKHAQDLDASYLLELEPDRMLAYFRIRAGLERRPSPTAAGMAGDGTSRVTSPATTCRR
jgi:hypothetical protein